jgi:phage terminase large subunit
MGINSDVAYQPLYTSKKRYFLITGGRGSAKSHHVHEFILRLTYEAGHGILFTRYTMTSAETSIIPDFKDAIERLGLENDFYITTKDIFNIRTRSFVWFRGIKASSHAQKANLKSLSKITTWVVEEGEDFPDEKTFDKVDDSVRLVDKRNRIIWLQNPSEKEHFIYKRWIENTNIRREVHGADIAISTHPDVEHIHTTYHVSKEYLSKDWLKKAEQARTHDTRWYNHNYLGQWEEKPEGVIFENWKEGRFNDSIPYIWGLDFGYSNDPDALVKVAVDTESRTIWLKQYVYQTGNSVEIIGELLQEICGVKELIVADSAESRLIDYLWDKKLNIKRAAKGSDSVRSGIKKLQGFQIIVDPDSNDLKIELNNYKWHDKRSGKPVDNFNHLIDAVRYAFEDELEAASFFVG